MTIAFYEECAKQNIHEAEPVTDEGLVERALGNLSAAPASKAKDFPRYRAHHSIRDRATEASMTPSLYKGYRVHDHTGTLNDVNRRQPWKTIANECGVTAALQDGFEPLDEPGFPAFIPLAAASSAALFERLPRAEGDGGNRGDDEGAGLPRSMKKNGQL